ncbi:MAG: hypothetical protein AMJ95_09680 [Omnitrophica WOR_2 bacterium SM23_72]|nr:MAG: hypothetical protein AMJ95_09680 [Omnitrophica WOR_2 bacterium SM23_72]
MKKCIFFLGIGLFLFFHCTAFAQLVLDKREIKIEAKPGETVSGSVTVTNRYKQDVTLKAYCEDFVYEPPYRGFKTVRPLGSTPRSFGPWITLTTPMFIVPSKDKQEVMYTVKVPQDAKGGYYAVIFFEKGESALTAEKGVGIREKAGCALFLETTNKEKKAKIGNIVVNKDSIEGYFSNSGDCVFVAQGSFYIMDSKGMIADRGQIQKYYLPAQAEVLFSVKVSEKVPLGKHTLMINFDTEEGKTLIKEVDFSKDKSGALKILAQRD